MQVSVINKNSSLVDFQRDNPIFGEFMARPYFDNQIFMRNSTVFPEINAIKPSILMLFQQLKQFEKLEENFDGYGAASPSQKAINVARNFLAKFMHTALPFYFVSPGVNGEILMEFKLGNKTAEIYFNEDGSNELLFFEGPENILEGNIELHLKLLFDFFN
jgi:hypothetical protein